MKNGLKFVGLIAIAALAVAACGAADVPTSTTAQVGQLRPEAGRPVPASAIHRLTVMADRAIKANEGHGVAWATVVVTTHAKALTSATPGDFVPDKKTIVYLVTIKGHFVAVGASVPPGATAPRGTYLSMVISAKTLAGLDGGLSAKAPPVSPASLGPVTHLKVHVPRGRR